MIKPVKNYEIRNYNVAVKLEGTNFATLKDVKLKVYLNGDLRYATKSGAFEWIAEDTVKFNFKSFKFEPVTSHRIHWIKVEDKNKFLRWCTNFRVCTKIQQEVSSTLQEHCNTAA